jgi:hypothetical protein
MRRRYLPDLESVEEGPVYLELGDVPDAAGGTFHSRVIFVAYRRLGSV